MNKEDRLTAYICDMAHGKAFRAGINKLSKDYYRGTFDATAIVDRLAQYEDTGLSPDEIKQLRTEYEKQHELLVQYELNCTDMIILMKNDEIKQ